MERQVAARTRLFNAAKRRHDIDRVDRVDRDRSDAQAPGEALRIDGEPEVPDWRPSPMQASEWMPFLMR